METEGIEGLLIETHNWGKSAKFFQTLGYEIEFATDHNSGQLRRGDGPSLFIAEVPELPGCAADGPTYEEALKNVGVIVSEWIETARDLGRPVPAPRGRLVFA